MIPSNDRPRLREDLVAEAIEDRGARFIDVIDPDNGNSYRFYDVEYSLACAMDGERDIPGLVRWAQEELGIAPTAGELQNVIATLGDLGYLDRVDARPGLAEGVVAAPPVSAPATGIEVELGRYQAEQPAAAKAEPAAELELGVAGAAGGSLEIESDEPAEVLLGPSGAAAASLPVPTPAAARPARAETPLPVPAAERRAPSAAEPAAAAQAKRPSEQQVRGPGRSTEIGVRPSEQSKPVAAPARTSQPKLRPSEQQMAGSGASDPSLNLSLPIRPDDVKEAVRASREMRSVDVPPELMAALEAAEQPASSGAPGSGPVRSRPATAPPIAASALPPTAAARPSSSVPSAAILDPIAPLSASSPLSVSEPISPPSVPPLVPAPRAESRSEKPEAKPELRRDSKPEVKSELRQSKPDVRAKSEPRLEYPRAADQPRPALAPAPRDPAPAVATPVPDVPQKRSSSMWIVAVLVIAILGVVGFGVWKFVLNKKATEPAPVKTTEPAVNPEKPVTPTEPPPPPPAPTAKLSLVKDPSISVKMPAAGALQSVVADGTVVKEGDEVARLAGGAKLEKEIASAKGDLEKRYPADIARLKAKVAAAPNSRQAQAELAAREARVAQRTKDLEGYQAELDKLLIKAPTAGKVTLIAKAGARLAAEAEIVSIDPEAHLSGAVDLGKPTTAKAGDSIDVKIKGDSGATASCTLETVQDSKVSFHCPVAEGFADGTEVTVEAK